MFKNLFKKTKPDYEIVPMKCNDCGRHVDMLSMKDDFIMLNSCRCSKVQFSRKIEEYKCIKCKTTTMECTGIIDRDFVVLASTNCKCER